MKRKSPRTYQSYSPSPRSANLISEFFSTKTDTKRHLSEKSPKETLSPHYVKLKQAIEKLETELLFLKGVNIRD